METRVYVDDYFVPSFTMAVTVRAASDYFIFPKIMQNFYASLKLIIFS